MDDEMRPVSAGMAKFLATAQRAGMVVDLEGPDPVEPPGPDVDQLRTTWLDRVWQDRIPLVFGTPTIRKVQDAHGREVAAELIQWAEGRPTNLILMGPVGTGKSYTALAAAFLWLRSRYEFLRAERDAFVVHQVVELLDDLRPGGDTAAKFRAQRARLLMLDDLGAERATEWAGEQLYGLVNRRWLDGLPTIATTNVPADDLKAALGDRVLSRLAGGATVLRLTGPDRRRT